MRCPAHVIHALGPMAQRAQFQAGLTPNDSFPLHTVQMNQPDRYSRFVAREGEEKVAFAKDSKMPNAGTFTIVQEDHTTGNLVRCRLLADNEVVFAGYRIPHPLENKMLLMVQTTNEKLSPQKAVDRALEGLAAEVQDVRASFTAGAAQHSGREQPVPMTPRHPGLY